MISAVMISCEARERIRYQTLVNLSKTDWEWEVEVILDKNYISEDIYERIPKTERQTIAAYNALKQALKKSNPWIVFMEDDLIFNKYITNNILNWEPIKQKNLNLGSLYTPNNNRCSIEEGNNWYKADCLKLYGSQFFILSRLAAQWAVDRWDTQIGMQDIRITRLSRGKPIYYHSPSLVQHMPIESVWGGVSHQASDFDLEWKCS